MYKVLTCRAFDYRVKMYRLLNHQWPNGGFVVCFAQALISEKKHITHLSLTQLLSIQVSLNNIAKTYRVFVIDCNVAFFNVLSARFVTFIYGYGHKFLFAGNGSEVFLIVKYVPYFY